MKKLLISSLVGGLVAVATLVAGTAAAAPATRNADGDPVVRTADGLVRAS